MPNNRMTAIGRHLLNEPGMTLQYRNLERGQIVWRDYTVDGEVVKSTIDIDKLPWGKYRLV